MQNKLQELTQQLYDEGLAKGRQEGDRYLEQARLEADKTLSDARERAAQIIEQAQKSAEDMRQKAESDVRLAASQALQTTRRDVENLIIAKVSEQKSVSDPEFLKEIIRTVASRFTATEGPDVSLVLPEALQDKLEPWVKGELSKALGAPVEASFSKKIGGGFTIGPKDGSYFISMTDKTFDALIAEFLRPVTRKLLFGE